MTYIEAISDSRSLSLMMTIIQFISRWVATAGNLMDADSENATLKKTNIIKRLKSATAT